MRLNYWIRQHRGRMNQSLGSDKRGFKYWFKVVVKSPYLQFVVGVVMLISSFNGQQGSLYADLVSFKFTIHHGVNFMGVWNILQALPNMMDSVSLLFNRWLDD